ncbi:hypothetical protein H0I39_06890 [Ottowia beijingensis]|uniref:Uncharacterized protein n=1 Tax=Ottowia beijingensis TaxID=1207057 RepID=A0A853IWE0_9BURK|nr:hypothetical protein [Ottowia beijingensis]NZA01560.1 hypothetical protein [Ottowia beijingensis]
MSQSQPTPPTEPIETTTPLQPATGTRETVDLTEAAPTDAQLLPTEREQTPAARPPPPARTRPRRRARPTTTPSRAGPTPPAHPNCSARRTPIHGSQIKSRIGLQRPSIGCFQLSIQK